MIRFLREKLALEFHPDKVSISTFAPGVDFLGWVHFPYHYVLRTVTRRRVIKKLQNPETTEAAKQSYFGLLAHGNAYGIRQKYNHDTRSAAVAE